TQGLGEFLGGVAYIGSGDERPVGRATLQCDQLFLEAPHQRQVSQRLLAVAYAHDIDRQVYVVGPLGRIAARDGTAPSRPPLYRPGACALDGTIDQPVEPPDRRLGKDTRDQVLALLACRHDAIEAPQRLVEAVGIEALIVAANARAVLAHRRQMLQ